MWSTLLSLVSLVSLVTVRALPTPSIEARQAITTLTPAQISAFKPFTFYASAGYCDPSTTLSWSCGANCNANPTFKPIASGGDGVETQFWFVGFDPTLSSVIVSHQGTDPSEIIPLLTDADFILENLDSSLFPGISSSVEVHSGFAATHSRSAPSVLSAVQTALTNFQANQVTIVGHSLGGAIALLDAVYLPLHLSSGVTFKTVTYGMPRVGNPAFASYVDAHVTSLNHINNKEDLVPILPGKFLGYAHPGGELHIQDSGSWVSCPARTIVVNKIELITGVPVPNQRVLILNNEEDPEPAGVLEDDSRPLGFYGVRDRHVLKVVDTNPSTSFTGQLTDVSQVEKFELTENEYAQRQDTVLAYKQRHKIGRFAEKTEEPQAPAPIVDIPLGSRCEVETSEEGFHKRGAVRFVGPTKFGKGGGVWVGVEYDEPIGRNDGRYWSPCTLCVPLSLIRALLSSVEGERYFTCKPNFGVFVRPDRVKIGDFPVEEINFDDDEEI
ncbi:hypothetical protein NLI96_g6166 [Meripilus lineatus]|uniref:CAP-Gly domain-containing protein n=1 Tax=Meripilus lineatus TaxID=2056292 RepID=A0AAD5V3W5_9APHY|nr:hypothetical protein NLI96_g6166 [Physisporinus lineatus]